MHWVRPLVAIHLLVASAAFSQACYSGFVGKYPIEFVIENPDAWNQSVEAVYLHKKHSAPIPLQGSYQVKALELFERKSDGKRTASLAFPAFASGNVDIEGVWKDLDKKKVLPAFVWTHFHPSAVEQDGDAEIFNVAEATCG